MDAKVLEYLKRNKKDLGTIEFETFFESNDFNNLNEYSKRTVFYFNIFLMSSKKYSCFNDIINDFIKITSKINENDYLKNTHECYEQIIINYLNKIKSFFTERDTFEDQKEFIDLLTEFVEQRDSIYYPNEKMKRNTIKYWKDLAKYLNESKENISQEFMKRFERYQGKLSKYISELSNNGNDINDINVNDNSSYHNNSININIQNNLNNNFSQNNNFEIINNSISQNNSSIRDSKKYYDSLMPFNQSINNKSEAEGESESDEEVKLEMKYKEVDNFIDNEIIPQFFNPQRDEIQENLKLSNIKDEINDDQNSMNNDSIKESISSITKKKKKKKKKKNNKNSQNLQNSQNDYNNLIQNLNGVYRPVPNMANIQFGIYIPPIRPGDIPKFCYTQPNQNNNIYQIYPYQINNNYDMNQNQLFMKK